MKKSWDRTQVPLPFSRIEGTFAKPIYPREGESLGDYVIRIQQTLYQLECDTDPEEAANTMVEQSDLDTKGSDKKDSDKKAA